MKYKVFVIWQSQKKEESNYIRRQLNKSKDMLKKEKIELDLYFAPTQDNAGSPNINEEIKEKIRTSDIAIADLTNISKFNELLISNPNVMYEIGLADILLGEERMIMLCEKSVDIEKLAFDINHQRISKFDINNNSFYKQLCEWIKCSLIESEKQNFLRKYFINNVMSDIEILFNYFLDYAYSDGYLILKENDLCFKKNIIRDNFKNGKFCGIKVFANMNLFISNFENKLYRLNNIVEKRLFIQLINLVQLLKNYIFLFNESNPFEKSNDENEKYNILSKNSFMLKSVDNYGEAMNSAYFRSDIVVINRLNGNRYLFTKNMIDEVLSKDRLYTGKIDSSLGIGTGMTLYNDDLYIVKNIDIENHVDLIMDILNSIVKICINLNMEFKISDVIVFFEEKKI